MSLNMNKLISAKLLNNLASITKECVSEAIKECGILYNFDGLEAISRLRVNEMNFKSIGEKNVSKKSEKVSKKSSFPLPYSGLMMEGCCHSLRSNNGLYTQCNVEVTGESLYCQACEKKSCMLEYGTIEDRQKVSIMEYVDPKGRKPVAFTKIMKKLNKSRSDVEEEAEKQGVTVAEVHFEEVKSEPKRGRPKAEKEAKEPKGPKGRPKKTEKVLEINDDEDMFSHMVASVQTSVVEDESSQPIVENNIEQDTSKAEEEKALKKQKAEEEKALKKQQAEEEKALKKQQAEEEKALKKQQAEEEKALKKQKAEEEKAAKALKKQQEDDEKSLKKQQAEASKASKAKPSQVPVKKQEVAKKVDEPKADEEEADVVKKIVFEDKKYLKSKKTGIIYDYNEYVSNGEQVVVGQWNDKSNKIDFVEVESEEELEEGEMEEEEYDE